MSSISYVRNHGQYPGYSQASGISLKLRRANLTSELSNAVDASHEVFCVEK